MAEQSGFSQQETVVELARVPFTQGEQQSMVKKYFKVPLCSAHAAEQSGFSRQETVVELARAPFTQGLIRYLPYREKGGSGAQKGSFKTLRSFFPSYPYGFLHCSLRRNKHTFLLVLQTFLPKQFANRKWTIILLPQFVISLLLPPTLPPSPLETTRHMLLSLFLIPIRDLSSFSFFPSANSPSPTAILRWEESLSSSAFSLFLCEATLGLPSTDSGRRKEEGGRFPTLPSEGGEKNPRLTSGRGEARGEWRWGRYKRGGRGLDPGWKTTWVGEGGRG